jgi:hypothetical protein
MLYIERYTSLGRDDKLGNKYFTELEIPLIILPEEILQQNTPPT